MPVPLPLAAAVVVLATVAGGTLGAVTRRWLGRGARGVRIPPPWCEAGVGGLWGGVTSVWAGGAVSGSAVGLLLGLCWLAVVGSAVDLAVRRLPDALTWPAVPVVLASLVPLGGTALLRGVAGAVLLCAAHGLVRLRAPSAMGGGDVKLAASIGAASAGVSWSAVVVGTVLAAVLTAAAGAVLTVLTALTALTVARGARRVPGRGRLVPGRGVPHGPSMLLACLVTVMAAAAWPGVAEVG